MVDEAEEEFSDFWYQYANQRPGFAPRRGRRRSLQ
jgi:hypothetical protein